MNTIDFLVVGDLHISGIDRLFPNYNLDANDFIYKSLNKIISYGLENGVSNIILCGDIFDNPNPDQKLQEQFLKYLLDNKEFKFFIIAGNHDYLNSDTVSLKMAEFATNYVKGKLKHIKFFTKPELVYIENVPFSFLPWPFCKTLHNPSVNIAHVEISGSKTDNGKIIENGYKISKNGVFYIGHLHCKQEYQGKNAFYPGMLYQKTFGEPYSPKGFYHSTVTYKNNILVYKHQYQEIEPVYKLVNLKIEKLDDLKQIKKPDPDRIVQYKIMMRNGVELPLGFRSTYTNVIDVTGKLSAKELSSMEKNSYQTDLIDVDTDYLDGLDEILINDGLNPKQLSLANKIVDRYLAGK